MKKLIMLMAVFGGLALASVVSANSLTLVNDAPLHTGAFDWNYHVDYSNSTLVSGTTFITINGVQGVTSATGPAGWTGSFTATSVTWTYTGPTTNLGPGAKGTIVGFTYHSIYGTAAVDPYHSEDQNATTGNPSTVNDSVLAASIPDGGSAVALLGIGLATIEGLRRKIGARKA